MCTIVMAATEVARWGAPLMFVCQGMRRSTGTPTDRRDSQKSEMPMPMANATSTAFRLRKSTLGHAKHVQKLMEVFKSLLKHITRTAVVSEGLSYRSEVALSALQCTLLIARHNLSLLLS